MESTYQTVPDTTSCSLLEEKMNQYWDDRSESYSAQNRGQLFGEKKQAWEELIFHQLPQTKPLRVLDIGTGPGFFAILAALRGHQVTAVDLNGEMLKQARENAASCGVSIHFQQVGNRLPFAAGSFDLVMSRDVTWTLTSPEEQLLQWASLLAPGGTMLYFDAEWYGYLKSDRHKRLHDAYRKEVKRKGGFCYQKANDMESVAVNLPMTYRNRPQWDRAFWQARPSYTCELLEGLNETVYNPTEQMQYAPYPEFLVRVKRKP